MAQHTQERPKQQERLGRGLSGNGSSSSQPDWATLERMFQTSPDDFGGEIKRRWGACEQIAQQVIQLVEGGELEVQAGFGIIACALGQTFSYSAFHQQPTVSDMVTLLAGQVSPPS